MTQASAASATKIPDTLGAWDFPALRQAVREHDADEASREERRRHLQDQFAIAMMQGVASVPAAFAKPWPSIGVPTFAQVMGDGLDGGGLTERAMQLLLDVVHGKDVQAAAMQLVVDAGARWADGEVDQ